MRQRADAPGDRVAFAERIRLQVLSRYRGTTVEVDPARYALRVRGREVDVTLPLGALFATCEHDPSRTSAHVAEFVAAVEPRLVPAAQTSLSLTRVLWCVRTRRYLQSLARSDALLTHDIEGDLVAFVAESLPGQVMRGVARSEWESAGTDVTSVRRSADENTERRFARTAERIAGIDRIPADGWRLAGDSLYQGSIVMVPALLRAFYERAGGDVLIGLPDRALALILPASLPSAEGFQRRVTQQFREAMNPCSRQVLRYDGTRLRGAEKGRRPPALLPWLNDD